MGNCKGETLQNQCFENYLVLASFEVVEEAIVEVPSTTET